MNEKNKRKKAKKITFCANCVVMVEELNLCF